MASKESLEALEAVYGQAEGQLESGSRRSSESSKLLPFLFSLAPKDAHHVRLCISDFHSQTWQSDFSVPQLERVKDVVGIGGKFDEFLTYLRAAFSSNNVKFMDNAVGSQGASSARLVAQKAPRAPRIELKVQRLQGSAAEDAEGSIALGVFQAFHAMSSALVSEKAEVAGLKAALAAEKAKTEKLQEIVDLQNPSLMSRNRLKRTISPLSAYVSQQASQMPSQMPTQFGTQEVLPSLQPTLSGTLVEDSKGVAVPEPRGSKSRGRLPITRRVKPRGFVIKEETDD